MDSIQSVGSNNKIKQVKISGKTVTLVFNKEKPGQTALIIAKDMLTNSYAHSIFTVAK